MLDLSENSCYLTVIRPPAKSIQHCTSGACEIERVSLQNNHVDLEYSIKHSKMLRGYKKKYPYSSPFIQEQCEEMFIAKNIHEDKSKFYVGKILKQLHCTLYSEIYLQKLRQQKYNSKNQQHQNQLVAIWRNLKPDQELTGRCSDQWISIGFQANDPATDFRGAGALGLKNLHKFSEKPLCLQLFKIAIAPQTQYFFCSASLFFTMLGVDLVRYKKINYDFWVHKEEQQIFAKFQMVYEMLFKQFTKFWLDSCDNKSIMFFNHNLKNFQKEVKSWSSKVLKARIQDSL